MWMCGHWAATQGRRGPAIPRWERSGAVGVFIAIGFSSRILSQTLTGLAELTRQRGTDLGRDM